MVKSVGVLVLALTSSAFASPTPGLLEEISRAHGGKDHFYSLRDAYLEIELARANSSDPVRLEMQAVFEDERKKVTILSGSPTKPMSQMEDEQYFWLTLPFKLQDKGYQTKDLGIQNLGDQVYRILEFQFTDSNGKPPYRFRIFTHPKTHLIERMAYDLGSPSKPNVFLVQFEHKRVNGLTLLTHRKIYKGSWDGIPTSQPIETQKTTLVRFWNGFTLQGRLK
jgi:hypothetical protein